MLSELFLKVSPRPKCIAFECSGRKELAPTPRTSSHHRKVEVALENNKVTVLKLTPIAHIGTERGAEYALPYNVGPLNRGCSTKFSGT